MDYTLTTREATMAADEFVGRYRDEERFEALCKQCPSHGKVWSCPPFDVGKRTPFEAFKTVTVMGTTIEFSDALRAACHGAKAKSKEVSTAAMREVMSTLLPQLLEKERLAPGSRAFAFRCSLCPDGCTRAQGLPCRHPGRVRPSLEAVGFDVCAITRDMLGIDLEWSDDGSLPKHITLVTAVMT